MVALSLEALLFPALEIVGKKQISGERLPPFGSLFGDFRGTEISYFVVEWTCDQCFQRTRLGEPNDATLGGKGTPKRPHAEAFSMTFRGFVQKDANCVWTAPARSDWGSSPLCSSFGLPGGFWWRHFFQALSTAPPGRGPESHFGFALEILVD